MRRFLLRFLKLTGLFVIGLVLVLVLFIAAIWGADAYYSREAFPFAWDSTAENTAGIVHHRYTQDGKQRGVSVMGARAFDVEPVLRNNIEWIAVTPFGWQREANTPTISRDREAGERWAPRDEDLEHLVRTAKQRGLRVFLKPHLWLTHTRRSRSEIAMDDEAAWQTWFGSYRAFLLHYAALAQRLDVDLLSVGTELERTATLREADWRALIAAVRQVYHGPLTYAANWNREYENIAFWDALDYIGIQAYFPLTDQRRPTVAMLREGWAPHARALEAISRRYDRPVLFTEIGYKSTEASAAEPWRWLGMMNGAFQQVSVQTQHRCYQAFFETFWDQPWFAGAYFWTWHARHSRAGGPTSRDFTPQHKPAQNTMAIWFGERHVVVSDY